MPLTVLESNSESRTSSRCVRVSMWMAAPLSLAELLKNLQDLTFVKPPSSWPLMAPPYGDCTQHKAAQHSTASLRQHLHPHWPYKPLLHNHMWA